MVGWWRIKAMSSYDFKEKCISLVRLPHCLYYPMCRIARQFGNHQGVSRGNGSSHTVAFTKRILGTIRETWSRRVMNRDIRFPQFLHPTLGYKDWLSTNMREIHREKKDHKKSKKRKRTEWLPWYAQIPCIFIWVNKGLKCSKSPMKTIYHLLIRAIRESIDLLSLLIVFFFSFHFFQCHVIFAHDVLMGIFAMPIAFSLIFCLDCCFGFSN